MVHFSNKANTVCCSNEIMVAIARICSACSVSILADIATSNFSCDCIHIVDCSIRAYQSLKEWQLFKNKFKVYLEHHVLITKAQVRQHSICLHLPLLSQRYHIT